MAAGERRRTSLKLLLKEKKIPANFAVPCIVRPEDEAVELSLAENIIRVAMHPIDQFAAFAALIDDGRILYFPDDTPAWCAFTLSDGKNVNAFVYARENAKPSVSTVNAPLSPEEIDRLIMEGTPPANNLGNLLDVLEPHLELNDFDAPVVNWQ